MLSLIKNVMFIMFSAVLAVGGHNSWLRARSGRCLHDKILVDRE